MNIFRYLHPNRFTGITKSVVHCVEMTICGILLCIIPFAILGALGWRLSYDDAITFAIGELAIFAVVLYLFDGDHDEGLPPESQG